MDSPEHTSLSRADVIVILDAVAPLLRELTSSDHAAALLKEDEVGMLCNLLNKQSHALEKELVAAQKETNAFLGKATAQDESSASQKSPDALEEPLRSLTIRVAILRARSAMLKQSWDVMMRKFPALPLEDLLHAAGVEEEKVPEVESLLNDSAWAKDAESPSRDFASRPSNTSTTGSAMEQSMGTEDIPASATLGAGPRSSRQ